MPRPNETNLEFPGKGLDGSTEYQSQPPGTCADAVNVRTQDPILEAFRGGSRPGLSRLVTSRLPGPVQDLCVLVSTETSALNSDYVTSDSRSWSATHPGSVLGVDYVLDPSTNNDAAGLGPRNPTGGRAIRVGGSGRPEYRPPVDSGPFCRTFHVAGGFTEGWNDFTICTDTSFPYDFTTFAVIGSWPFDPLIAPGPNPPTLAELLAIIAGSGFGGGNPYDSYTDVPE